MQQELELAGGEGEALAVLGDGQPGAVDGELRVLLDPGAAARGLAEAAQDGLDAGFDDLGAGGLDDVVVGARFEADDHVEVVPPRGQHDDRDLAGLADPAADLHPVDPGQHEVEQDQFRAEGAHQGEAALAGVGGAHLVAAAAQAQAHSLPDGRVVLDQQYAWHRVGIPGGSWLSSR